METDNPEHDQAHEYADLFELLSQIVDDTIDDAGMSALNTLIENDAKAREIYTGYMAMHLDIKRQVHAIDLDELNNNDNNSNKDKDKNELIFKRYVLYQRLSAVAALIAFLSLAWAITSNLNRDSVINQNKPISSAEKTADADLLLIQQPEPTYQSVAVISDMANAIWQGSQDRIASGQPLNPGTYAIESGILKVECYSGTTMWVRAPAKFKLSDMNSLQCLEGSYRFMAGPVTSPFRIDLPFGQMAFTSGDCAITIEGERVAIRSSTGTQSITSQSQTQTINAGDTIALSASGQLSPLKTSEASFVQPDELRQTKVEGVNYKELLWQKHLTKMAKDESVIRHYTFQGKNGSRVLKNHGTTDSSLNGTVIGSQWRKGRWQGKRALAFNKEGDRVRIHVPGEFKNLSMTCWLYIEKLDNLYNAIFMTDGYESREVHWQIRSGNGDLVLGVQADDEKSGRGLNYEAKGVLDKQHLNQWLLLALVYNGEKGTISHFINGQRVSEETIAQPGPLRIGDAAIGNWLATTHEKRSTNPFRRFNGKIDELILFDRPLTESEIKDLHEIGKPFVGEKSVSVHSEF